MLASGLWSFFCIMFLILYYSYYSLVVITEGEGNTTEFPKNINKTLGTITPSQPQVVKNLLPLCDVSSSWGACYEHVMQYINLATEPSVFPAMSMQEAPPTVATRYGLAYFINGKPCYPPKGKPLEKVDIDLPLSPTGWFNPDDAFVYVWW